MDNSNQDDQLFPADKCEPYEPDVNMVIRDWARLTRKELRGISKKKRTVKPTAAPSNLIGSLITRFTDYDKPVIDYTFPQEED